MKSHDIRIRTADGCELAATVFEPAGSERSAPVTIIGSATGVPRRYYAKLALYLAEHGQAVVTFDYRGVGQSRHGPLARSKVRMRDWGILDIPAVLEHARRTMPERPIHWIGHSYGGFGTGLAHNNRLIQRQLCVSSMSAYLGHLPAATHYRLRFMMAVPMQLTSHALGYFPGVLIGGEDLPKGVALEWSRWCRTRGFLFGDGTLPEKNHFASFTAPIRFAYADDDPWLALKGVEHLARQFRNARETSIWRIGRAEAGGKVGHLGFFRSEFKDTLWAQARAWLDERRPVVRA